VIRALEGVGAAAVREVAILLTSELVTNAIVHVGGGVELRVNGDAGVVRITVRDSSPTPPKPRTSDDRAVTGRGLGLVEQLAARWGTDLTTSPRGKEVWFELRL
jgi:anti-sigma regulatory factor (Ser/Thr protein kinase)